MALPDTAAVLGLATSNMLDPSMRSQLGQYMTPAPTGRFMASLFNDFSGDLKILDPGAGTGTLTAVLVERLCKSANQATSVSLVCYELSPELAGTLHETLAASVRELEAANVPAEASVRLSDYILDHSFVLQSDLFTDPHQDFGQFTHVIMNPPYSKIRSGSAHRSALRSAGLETSNLYTGFMYLAAQQLRLGGEMVAIVPRSFCNGPYFKPFRKRFFSMMTLQHIHVFEKRDSVFKADKVLQENIILHAVKGAELGKIHISVSNGALEGSISSSQPIYASGLQRTSLDYSSVIYPDDPDRLVRIVAKEEDQRIAKAMAKLTYSLADIGLEVSTGPVVDFRAKRLLLSEPDDDAAPLLHPAHFQGQRLQWPKSTKKANSILVTEGSRKHLWANKGSYVVTRRFTTKEENRRIVASLYNSNLPGDLIGFENHLNVYHVNREGFSPALATGLKIYLNSTFVDRYFRQLSGHTQVNAADLKSLRYPARNVLERIGLAYQDRELTQEQVDDIIDSELSICLER